jgi:hypothetical protein
MHLEGWIPEILRIMLLAREISGVRRLRVGANASENATFAVEPSGRLA